MKDLDRETSNQVDYDTTNHSYYDASTWNNLVETYQKKKKIVESYCKDMRLEIYQFPLYYCLESSSGRPYEDWDVVMFTILPMTYFLIW